MTSFRYLLTRTLLGGSVLAAPISAQTVHRPATPTCEACRIELTHEVSLGERNGPGTIDSELALARRDSRGRYFTIVGDGYEIKVFDVNGAYLQTLGREGSGPTEFRSIANLFIGAGDSVHVLDRFNARRTVFSPDFMVARTQRLDLPMVSPDAALVTDGRLIVAQQIRLPGHSGQPLHIIGLDGVLGESFGVPEGAETEALDSGRRALALLPDQSHVWVAYTNQYRLELWSLTGVLQRRMERQMPWFPPQQQPARMSTGVQPQLPAIQLDESGLLWSLVNVADPQWTTAAEVSPSGEHRVIDIDRYYDTMIEVFDPLRSELIATVRSSRAFTHFVDAQRIGAVVMDADGYPSIQVWRLALEGG